ncbi:MAG TPA: hypothetical protein VKA10_02310 [Prolixibacteraceae bacterium]|nr:hypothetical protein [Prolixibacteraceae bacterium]
MPLAVALAFACTEGGIAYNLKLYVFVPLKSSETKSKDFTEAANYQKMHLANLNKLADEGRLIVVDSRD